LLAELLSAAAESHTLGGCIHRMDKVLTEMSVRLSSAVTDLSWPTGLAIIQAIVNGERQSQEENCECNDYYVWC